VLELKRIEREAHGPVLGDEDEGSSLQSEANRVKRMATLHRYAGKIDRSAEALRMSHDPNLSEIFKQSLQR